MTLSPKESAEFVVKNAEHVQVHEDGIKNIVKEVIKGLQNKTLDINNFSQNDHHPNSSKDYAPNWIFLVDTLNFCFWTLGESDTKYKVCGETGYFALCAAINRALSEGIDITNPGYYSKITMEELQMIFRSDDKITKVPLLEDRLKCLHEVGKVLLEKYDGKFENVVKLAENSAVKLLNLVVRDFPCFRDEADFNGKRVSLYKRAQILIGDLWSCFRGEKLGLFTDLQEITMFADYRVPQALIHFKAMSYSDELMSDLKNNQILLNGSAEEVEIRLCSIYIVEKVKEQLMLELANNHPDISTKFINSIFLDHFLWDYRRKYAKELAYIPFHKTYSVYY